MCVFSKTLDEYLLSAKIDWQVPILKIISNSSTNSNKQIKKFLNNRKKAVTNLVDENRNRNSLIDFILVHNSCYYRYISKFLNFIFAIFLNPFSPFSIKIFLIAVSTGFPAPFGNSKPTSSDNSSIIFKNS